MGDDGGGPAARLFLDRAGIALEPLDHEERQAVVKVCERAGGLPLALELAAASVDLHGLVCLASEGTSTADSALRNALRWSTEVLPHDSARLLLRAALLPGGLSTSSAACLAGVGSDHVRRVLGPLVQARLVAAADRGPAGVRYREPEPVREMAAGALSVDEQELTGELIVGHLTALGKAVGDIDGRNNLAAVPAAEAEMANVRHWLGRRLGTEEGLSLAIAMAPTMRQIGLGAEGRRWLDAHRAATPTADPRLVARAIVAGTNVSGFFAAALLDAADLQGAAVTAERHEDWRLWVAIQGYLASAKGWSGDAAGGLRDLKDQVLNARLAELDDPWMDRHHDRLLALGIAVTCGFSAGRTALEGLADQFLALDDPGSALQTLFLRAWFARADGDMDGAAHDLVRSRELAATGAARGTQALVGAELAHLARHRKDPSAVAMLTTAIDDLERAGNLRSAAAQRRDLGAWRMADGDRAGGLADLRNALPMLLRTDRQAAAVALAELAEAVSPLRPEDAARLARAARRMLVDTSGAVDPGQQARVREVAANCAGEQGAAPAGEADISDDVLLLLAFEPGDGA